MAKQIILENLPFPEFLAAYQQGRIPVLYYHVGAACNLACLYCNTGAGRPEPGELTLAELKSVLDQAQALRVMWFLDYDLSGVGQEGPFRQERVEETGTPRRAATLAAPVLAARLPSVGPHVLEAFVIEEDALSASSATVPEWRAMRDCQSEGFPSDCVSTQPASFRWSVLISDEQCQ